MTFKRDGMGHTAFTTVQFKKKLALAKLRSRVLYGTHDAIASRRRHHSKVVKARSKPASTSTIFSTPLSSATGCVERRGRRSGRWEAEHLLEAVADALSVSHCQGGDVVDFRAPPCRIASGRRRCTSVPDALPWRMDAFVPIGPWMRPRV